MRRQLLGLGEERITGEEVRVTGMQKGEGFREGKGCRLLG